MGIGEDDASEHPAPAGDHTVGAGALVLHAEAARPVPAQPFDLGEPVVVEEESQPLPGRELALGVLRPGGLVAGASAHGVPYGLEFGDRAALLPNRPVVWSRHDLPLRPS